MNNDIDIKRSILLIMDYQNGIVGRMPNSDIIIDKLSDLLIKCRKVSMTIGYVRVALRDDEYELVSKNNKSFREAADKRIMNDQSEDTQIDQRVAPQPGDIIVRKKRVGAFSTTDLDNQLKERGIDTIILAGFSTSGVVLSTIRDAADKDYLIYVLADACSDPDQEVHNTLINKVFPRQTTVINTVDLPELLAIDR